MDGGGPQLQMLKRFGYLYDIVQQFCSRNDHLLCRRQHKFNSTVRELVWIDCNLQNGFVSSTAAALLSPTTGICTVHVKDVSVRLSQSTEFGHWKTYSSAQSTLSNTEQSDHDSSSARRRGCSKQWLTVEQ